MSIQPLPSGAHSQPGAPDPHRTSGYLLGGASTRERMPPTPGRIAFRRFLITLTKWVLPMTAAGLLALIALWPEIDAATTKAHLSMSHVTGELEGGKLIDARYNGVDEKGRPYTVTAATAWQIDAEKVGLTLPKGDITLQNGTWLMLTSKQGTFIQGLNQLDLVKDVTLYRDDGTTTAHRKRLDRRQGGRRRRGSEPVHVRRPVRHPRCPGLRGDGQGQRDRLFAGPGPCHHERG